jgi:cytochrome P450
MFQQLAGDADLQQRVRSDRELIPRLAEECLRLGTPLQCTFRLSRVRTKVGELEIAPGTTVMLLPAAANRDPRVFDEPDQLRLDRPNWRQHLAFGSGVHSCAGAPLARAEALISTQRLLDRMRDIRICEREHGPAGARRYRFGNHYLMRGLERLHLEFTRVA